MEKTNKLETVQPRALRFRSHYKYYMLCMSFFTAVILAYWGLRLHQDGWLAVWMDQSYEILLSGSYFAVFAVFYLCWLRYQLNRSVQVFKDHLLLQNGKQCEEIKFEDVESYSIVCWSVFYFRMKNGHKYYFSSSLERVDYVWEGFRQACPHILSEEVYEKFRLKLVQYDHHQKRKEWFFRHKIVDVLNWIVLPGIFLSMTYVVQSRDVLIYQEGLYFFRLFMYALLTMIFTTFAFSIGLKKVIFDKRIKIRMTESSGDKIRDLEFEGIILNRSKIFQTVTACLIFTVVARSDVNLFSVTKVREDLAYFNLKVGKTLLVDNRFNCVSCKFPVNDGDLVVFGRGHIGQVMAKEGEFVGQVVQDASGRMIASENMQEVPSGFIALKSHNGKDIMLVRLIELIGKIQK